jgi:hypothetical protein
MRVCWPLVPFLALPALLASVAVGGERAAREGADVIRYLRELRTAGTPASKTLLRQIEQGPAALERERQAMRQAGIPQTPGELGWTEPPPEENAAPLYARFGQLLRAEPRDPDAHDVVAGMGLRLAHPPEAIAQARHWLQERSEPLKWLHEAANRPRYWVRRDWSVPGGVAETFSTYATLREAGRVLKAESYLLGLDRRFPDAIRIQALGVRVAQHAAAEPSLIAYLVAVAIESITLEGFRDLLALAGPDAQVAAAVREAIARQPAVPDLRHALGGEVVQAAGTFALLRGIVRKGGPAGLRDVLEPARKPGPERPARLPAPTVAERQQVDRLVDAAEADALRRLRRMVELSARPYPEQAAAFPEHPAGPHPGPLEALRDLAVLDPPLSMRVTATSAAGRAVLAAGTAVLAYRDRQGAWPDTLAQALPQPPVDPFTGGPLDYRRQGDGFAVSARPPAGSSRIAFQYPPPPPPLPTAPVPRAPAP